VFRPRGEALDTDSYALRVWTPAPHVRPGRCLTIWNLDQGSHPDLASRVEFFDAQRTRASNTH